MKRVVAYFKENPKVKAEIVVKRTGEVKKKGELTHLDSKLRYLEIKIGGFRYKAEKSDILEVVNEGQVLRVTTPSRKLIFTSLGTPFVEDVKEVKEVKKEPKKKVVGKGTNDKMVYEYDGDLNTGRILLDNMTAKEVKVLSTGGLPSSVSLAHMAILNANGEITPVSDLKYKGKAIDNTQYDIMIEYCLGKYKIGEVAGILNVSTTTIRKFRSLITGYPSLKAEDNNNYIPKLIK